MVDESIYEDALSRSFNYTRHGRITKLDSNDFQVPLTKLGNSVPDVLVSDSAAKVPDLAPISDTTSQETLSLKHIDFKLNQCKIAQELRRKSLQLDHDANRKQPVYYKPPSSTMKFIQSGLTSDDKTQPQKNRIPLLIPKNYISNSNSNSNLNGNIDNLDRNFNNSSNISNNTNNSNINKDNEDESDSHPTGEWFNPIMKQALARQINKQQELKNVIRNVFILLICALIKSSVTRYLAILQAVNARKSANKASFTNRVSDANTNVWTTIISTLFTMYLVTKSIISLVKFMKKQDQCLDLPLNNQQRKLIGLEIQEPGSEAIDESEQPINAELTLKQRQYELNHGVQNYFPPKYPKISSYTPTASTEEKQNIEQAIQLNTSINLVSNPITQQLTKKPFSIPVSNHNNMKSEKKKFETDFGLNFNCKNDF